MPTLVTKGKKSLSLNGMTRKEKSHYSAHFFAFEKLSAPILPLPFVTLQE